MYDRLWLPAASGCQTLTASNVSVRSTALTVGDQYVLWGTERFVMNFGGSTVVATTTTSPAWPADVDLPCFTAKSGSNYVAVKRLETTSGKVYIFKVRTLS